MKKILLLAALVCCTVISINAHTVNLFKIRPSSPNILEGTIPTSSVITNRTNVLRINLDTFYYSCYTINLMSDDSSIDTTFVANSATINLLISSPTLDYVLTIDGGNHGAYEGIFNGNGNDSINLTDVLALKLVKNRRENNSDVHFYSANVNKIINDRRCPITTMPTATWANNDTISKSMIIADEGDSNYTYYYIPELLSVADTVPYIGISGNGISHQVILKPLNTLVNPSWQRQVSFTPNTGITNPYGNDIRVIIYAEDYGTEDYIMKWNECAAFYNILTQKYNIPKANIQVSAYRIEDIYNLPSNYSNDFDGDNIDEITGLKDWDVLLDSIRNDSFEQLVIYYAGDPSAKLPNGNMRIWDINMPKNIPSEIQTNYINYVFSTGQATTYARDYEERNVVLTCMTGSMEFMYNDIIDYYYTSPFIWLSVLANEDLITHNALPVTTDTNNDGYFSLHEIQNASNYLFNYESYYNNIFEISTPTSLHDSIGYNMNYPSLPKLTIRQLNDNTPISINWDSPDIWLRSTNDGDTNQSYECIKVTPNKNVYINVRVWNNGNKVYARGEKLHLFWEHPHLGVPGEYNDIAESWISQMPNYIGTINLNDSIQPNQCRIYTYHWTLPSDVQTINSFLAVNISACISDKTYQEFMNFYNERPNAPRSKLVRNNHVVINTNILPTYLIEIAPAQIEIYNEGDFTMTMYPETIGYDWFDLSLISDSTASNGNIFNTALDIYSRCYLYEDTVNVTQWDSDGIKLKFDGLNSQIIGAYANADGDNTFSLGGRIIPNYFGNSIIPEISHLLHVAMRDENNHIREGQSVRFVIPEYDPINDPTPLGIRATPDGNGNVTLSETNVTEPACYEWYDAELNKFDEGKTIVANKSEVGDIAVLKVTKSSDGRELYAVTTLDGVPGIENASPVPFDGYINVILTDNAVSNMSIRIVPVINTTNPIEQSIVEGSNNVMVNTSSLPSGQYVLSLMNNGNLVQSINIYKNN